MFSYTFTGRVLPERTYVSFQRDDVSLTPLENEVKHTFHSGDDIRVAKLHVRTVINNAQIIVNVGSEIEVNLEALRDIVETVAKSYVDAYGYLEGRGHHIEMTSAIDSTGTKWQVFGVQEPAIQATRGDRPDPGIAFGALFGKAEHNEQYRARQLRRALSDLQAAITTPDDTAFFCYRAIECLRHCYEDSSSAETSDQERKSAWGRMRRALCFERSWIEDIERLSKEQRHGSQLSMPHEVRQMVMQRTWKIVDRYIMSANAGFEPLSEPVLK